MTKLQLEIDDKLLRSVTKELFSFDAAAKEIGIKRPLLYYLVQNKYKLNPYIISDTWYLSRDNVEMIKKDRNQRKIKTPGN